MQPSLAYGLALALTLMISAPALSQAEPPPSVIKLSAVLKAASPIPPAVALADESEVAGLEDLKSQAQQFILFRRGKMGARQKLQWIAECLSHPSDNVYCEYLVSRKQARAHGDPIPGASGTDLYKISEALTRADLPALLGVTESQFHRALKLFPEWSQLAAVAQAALTAKSCPTPALLTSLGQKAEQFFPEPQFKTMAVSLYLRASECGPEGDESSAKAKYRASLLLVWSGECRKAEPLLVKLGESRDRDYISRSIFWRAHCAQAAGNKLSYAALRGKLLKEHPLSYHGLLMASRHAPELSRILESRDPEILYRSKSQPKLNGGVRAVEMLQSLHANELALELLDSLDESLEGTETSFQLYVALLLKRSGDMIAQFRLLASIFRKDPQLLSRQVMELYYPLQRYEVLKRYSEKLDPFLAAALIRQESGFNERARSPAGALGLMQLMPGTARLFERVSRRELMDAKTNIRLGVKYFVRLLGRYSSDAELALAAYNAGPEKVDEWTKRYPTNNRVLFLDLIPFQETRNYVALISRNYYWYLHLYGERTASRLPNGGDQLQSLKKYLSLNHFKSM